jgi:predicted phage tail protein
VAATDSYGTGAFSAAASPLVPGRLPAAPTTLSVIVASASSVKLAWSATKQSLVNDGWGIVRYQVAITPTGQATDYQETSSATFHQVLVTGLTLGTTYTFAVQALCDRGDGVAITSAPTLVAVKPGPPTSLLPFSGPGELSVSWDAPADAGAPVSYNLAAIRKGKTVATATTTDTLYEFTGLVAGTYTVKVRATDVAGSSSPAATSIKVD